MNYLYGLKDWPGKREKRHETTKTVHSSLLTKVIKFRLRRLQGREQKKPGLFTFITHSFKYTPDPWCLPHQPGKTSRVGDP